MANSRRRESPRGSRCEGGGRRERRSLVRVTMRRSRPERGPSTTGAPGGGGPCGHSEVTTCHHILLLLKERLTEAFRARARCHWEKPAVPQESAAALAERKRGPVASSGLSTPKGPLGFSTPVGQPEPAGNATFSKCKRATCTVQVGKKEPSVHQIIKQIIIIIIIRRAAATVQSFSAE